MTLIERLEDAFRKKVGGTVMLPASDVLSASTRIQQLESENAELRSKLEMEKYNYLGAKADADHFEAEAKALREDAERYRVLRSSVAWVVATRRDDVEYSYEWLDSEIDVARQGEINGLV